MYPNTTASLMTGLPRSSGLPTIRRPRLTAALDRALDVGVALVSAEAGAGKTTLLSSWAADLDGPIVAWVTCHEQDNDPLVLASRIRAAVAPAVEVPPSTPLGGVLGIDEPDLVPATGIVVILDDAHHLRSAQVLSALETMVTRRPPRTAFIVSGRDDPHLPWHKIRLGGVIELRGGDLAFEPSETKELLEGRFGEELSDSEVTELCEITGGWVTGLCLAGLTMRDPSQRADKMGTGLARHRFVHDFLEAEVMENLPAEDVRFLEVTSVLDVLDPELCAELSGRTDSLDVLERFCEMNLFTERVSGGPLRFKYHALFSEYLRHRAERSKSIDRTALLGVASRWFEDRGQMDGAIAASLQMGDYVRAERLIRVACGPAITCGLSATVVRWVSSLPAETIQSKPDLSLVLARTSLNRGDLLMARTAHETLSRDHADRPEPWVRIGLLQLSFLVHVYEGSLGGVIDEIDEAIELLGTSTRHPSLEMLGLDETVFVAYRAAALLLTGDLDSAITATDSVLTPAFLTHPTKATILGLGVRCLALAWKGEEDLAVACVESARTPVIGFNGSTGDGFPFYLASAWVSEQHAAARDLASARLIVEELGLPLYRLLLAVTEARYAHRFGPTSVAWDALAEADALIARMRDAGILGRLATDQRADLDASDGGGATGEPLTAREIEVLTEIASGASRREAAENLHLSVNTVKTYLRTAYRKLGVTNRASAFIEMNRLGIVDDPSTASSDALDRTLSP